VRTLSSTALRTVLAAAVPVGLVLSAAVVWQSTSAAFTAATDNPGNSWQTGSVALTDSDSNSALFNSANDNALVPGSTRSRCIRVDYTGNLPADIRFYVTTPAPGYTSLDPYLVMSVEMGQDVTAATPVAADCTTGFTPKPTRDWLYNSSSADLARTMSDLKTHSGWTSGLPVRTSVPSNTSLTFRITYTVSNDNLAQSTRSNASFVWEAQNS